jgi:hypothetical protein
MIKNETDSALDYLRENGHDVGQVHMPPPQVGNTLGNTLRVWIDSKSFTFEQVIELAAKERLAKIRN